MIFCEKSFFREKNIYPPQQMSSIFKIEATFKMAGDYQELEVLELS